MVDIALIDARLAEIDANPDSWTQETWINNTAHPSGGVVL